jgi:hypothetical protein
MTDDEKPRRTPDREPVSPAEFTKRMPEGESAGPGAPETDEPTQGRSKDGSTGPGGPAPRGLGQDAPRED